mgnify:CR=1 FL=1
MINNISDAIPAAQAGDQEGLNYIYYNTYKDQYTRVYGNISNIEMAEKDKEKFIQDILKEAYEFVFANIKYVTNINQFDGWLVNVVDDIATRKVAELESDDDKSAVGGVIVGASAGAGAAVGGSAAGNVLNANAAAAVNTGAVGSQAGEMAGNAVGTATGKAMAGNGVAGSMTGAGVGKAAAGAGKAAEAGRAAAGAGKAVAAAGATGAAKGGIVGTIGFKVVCGVIAVGVAGGAVTGAIVNHNDKKNKVETTTEATSENTTEVASSETTEVTTEETTEVTTEAAYAPVADDEWAEILKGGLTKPEFEYMLADVSRKAGKDGGIEKLTHDDINLLYLTSGSEKNGLKVIRTEGSGDTGYNVYNLSDVNAYVSVLTDDILTADNCNTEQSAKVNGDEISIYTGVTDSHDYDAEIMDSRYRTGDTMYVEYTYSYVTYADDPSNNYDAVKTAVLEPKEDGKYQVREILAGSIKDNFGDQLDDNGGVDDSQNKTTDNTKGDQSDMFIKTLKSIDTTQYEGEPTYNTDEFRVIYQLYDVNGDGEDDLIINYPINDGQPLVNYGVDVYINKGDKLVKAKNEIGIIEGTFVYTEKGIFIYWYGRMNGEMSIYSVNYNKGTLTSSAYDESYPDQRVDDGGLGKYTGWGEEYDVPEYQMTDYSPFN